MSRIEELLITIGVIIGIIIGIVILMLLLGLFCGLIMNFLFNNKNQYTKDDETTNKIFIEI
jgi:hypothetical protein